MARLPRPTLRQLEYLVAIEDTLGFREAARRCHVSQPALSAQLRQLEDSLQVTLFERDRRRVLPTHAGRELAAEARAVLDRTDRLLERVRALQAPMCGDLRLGTIPTVGPYVLPAVARNLRDAFPRMRLVLREDKTSVLVEQLERGDLDVLLLALDVELGDVESLHLFDDTFLLACHQEHPLAEQECVCEAQLEGEAVLLLDEGHCLRDQTLPLCQRVGAAEMPDVRASSLATLVQMVAAGIGVTLLPEMAVAREQAGTPTLVVRPCEIDGWRRRIGLVWRAGSPRREEFLDLGERIAVGLAADVAGDVLVPRSG